MYSSKSKGYKDTDTTEGKNEEESKTQALYYKSGYEHLSGEGRLLLQVNSFSVVVGGPSDTKDLIKRDWATVTITSYPSPNDHVPRRVPARFGEHL